MAQKFFLHFGDLVGELVTFVGVEDGVIEGIALVPGVGGAGEVIPTFADALAISPFIVMIPMIDQHRE